MDFLKLCVYAWNFGVATQTHLDAVVEIGHVSLPMAWRYAAHGQALLREHQMMCFSTALSTQNRT